MSASPDNSLPEDFWESNSPFFQDGDSVKQSLFIRACAAAMHDFFPKDVPPKAFGTKTDAKGSAFAWVCLGSHIITVVEPIHDPPTGNARWSQVVSTFPIQTPVIRPRQPLTLCAAHVCTTPQAFRQWLNLVATKILVSGCKVLQDALHPDNLCPDLRHALQTAHDISQLPCALDLTLAQFEVTPTTLPWQPTSKPLSYAVRVLSKGSLLGHLGLQWRPHADGHGWAYGGSFKMPTTNGTARLSFKQACPSGAPTAIMHVDDCFAAKCAATRLYYSKVLDWLWREGQVNPGARSH